MKNVIVAVDNQRATLRSQCLSLTEVIGQSIANIAPSATPAFTIPVVFALAGNGSWLAYLFATIVVLLIGYHINYFAKRSASPGALYTFVSDGLGQFPGFVSGSGLVLAYILTAAAVLPCFASFANVILGYMGIQVPIIILCSIGIFAAWFTVVKDVQISAKLMLACEAFSVLLIITLGIIVFVKSDFKLYINLLSLKGISLDSVRLGLVLAFFSFVGFESATTLGHEAKNPLKNIPKAVIISGAFVGVLFTIFSFIEIVGFIGSKTPLSASTAPLNYLATSHGVGLLGFFISLGATISFWSCAVASMTAAARILHSMASQKLIPAKLGEVHAKNETPHVALTIIALIVFIVPAYMVAYKVDVMNIFGYLGTIATLGFLLNYLMIVITAPVFLHRRKELKPMNIVMAIVTFLALLIPIVGSVYPLPAYPFNLFPPIFVFWIVISIIWYLVVNRRKSIDIIPNIIAEK